MASTRDSSLHDEAVPTDTAGPETIVLVAPPGSDTDLLLRALKAARLDAVAAHGAGPVVEILAEPVGTCLLLPEALDAPTAEKLASVLHHQPEWSDLPILLLERPGYRERQRRLLQLRELGAAHVVLLERPMSVPTLIAAVESALLARRRQYQVRDELRRRRLAEHALRASQHRLQREVEELNAIYEQAPIGLALLDTELRFVRINQHLAELNGLPVETHLGRRISDILPEAGAAIEAPLRHMRETGRPIRNREGEGESPYEPGVHRAWIENWTPLYGRDGQVVGFNGVVQDVTERKRAERALERARQRERRWNVELEREVEARTALLEQQAEDLRRLTIALGEAEQAERQRLSDLLHGELQQMLIAARTQLLVWMSRTGSPAPERALEILDEAIDCARSLSYDVSPPVRASAGLADELTWLAHWFRDRHGFTVTIESPPRTMDIPDAERLFLMQSLRELILNAAKYAGVEEARVDVRGTRSGVSVEVTDEGRGFDPAAIDLRERVSNGHGFGLLNIRERARALGGRLDLVSAPGQGTRATIFLPFEGLAEPAAEADDRQHSLL